MVMITAIHPGNNLVERECASLFMSFEPEAIEEKQVQNAACGHAEVEGLRPRHLRLVGTHIDVAFGQVDILWKLDKRTLERMATDRTTPVVVLERLAAHPKADVRAAVSDNENTPLYTLWALSKDSDADVRYQIAENHNVPLTLLRSMTNDENPYVACRAQQTYDRLQAV
jgi:hypothetical protein